MIGNYVYYDREAIQWCMTWRVKSESSLGGQIVFSPGYDKALGVVGQVFQIIDLPTTSLSVGSGISTNGVKKRINYHEEWMQIYNETWRQMRDFFYAENMHGVDWNKVYEKYKVLVPYVNHRTDLTYLIGEMIGELNVGQPIL